MRTISTIWWSNILVNLFDYTYTTRNGTAAENALLCLIMNGEEMVRWAAMLDTVYCIEYLEKRATENCRQMKDNSSARIQWPTVIPSLMRPTCLLQTRKRYWKKQSKYHCHLLLQINHHSHPPQQKKPQKQTQKHHHHLQQHQQQHHECI